MNNWTANDWKDWLKVNWSGIVVTACAILAIGLFFKINPIGLTANAETQRGPVGYHPAKDYPKGEYNEPRMPYATDTFIHGYNVEVRSSNTVFIDTRIFAAYSNVSIVVVMEDGSVWQTGNTRKVRAEGSRVIVE